MKKIILLALTAVMMVGCENPPEKTIGGWDVIVIDSCEYIRGYYKLAHKGNCKYCQERMKKMIKEVKDE